MDNMMGMMGGGQPPQMPGAGGPPGGGQASSPNPQDILQQMLGKPFPPMPGKLPKKNKGFKVETKNENKNTTPSTPQGKLQKARDLIKAVVNELGPQNDIASALSGQVRNLDMQLKKMGGADVTEGQITGKGDMGKPPLGVGTPGQVPENSGGGMQSPVNPDTLSQNLMGAQGAGGLG